VEQETKIMFWVVLEWVFEVLHQLKPAEFFGYVPKSDNPG